MTLLTLTSNNVGNPQTLDLSNYVVVNPGDGLDPADPAFTQRVWSRSLLKEGATLALEQLVEREMQFPLKLGPIGGLAGAPTSITATLGLIQQINQALETPGATITWQPPGASQPTTFDVLSGLIESQYNYRAEGQAWEFVNMRVFTQPLGRTTSVRPYAFASGIAPITYVAPSSYLAKTASSGGISYFGQASIAGDAPAKLIVVFQGASAVNEQAFVSLFPDANYPPMTPSAIVGSLPTNFRADSTAPFGFVWTFSGFNNVIDFAPTGAGSTSFVPPIQWEGQHRLFAFARASSNWATLGITQSFGNVVPQSLGAVASVGPPSTPWGLYDLGAFKIRASETLSGAILQVTSGLSGVVDIGGMLMIPDNSTWFVQASSIGSVWADDILGDQFGGGGFNVVNASTGVGRFTQPFQSISPYSRGLLPQPDPKNGLPILALCSMPAPNNSANNASFGPALSPPFRSVSAGVWVLERTRYLFG